MNRDWKQTFNERIAPRLVGSGLSGAIKVVVEEEAEAWYLALGPPGPGGAPGATVGLSRSAPTHLDAVLRGRAQDLEALLGGRMSLADGVLTERIGVSGELGLVLRLGRLLSKES